MRVERSSLDQVKARFALNKKKMDEKKKEYDLEQRTTELREEEEKLREYRREKKKEKKRKHIEEDHMGGDQDMMAMMGFGGFGGSKKNWFIIAKDIQFSYKYILLLRLHVETILIPICKIHTKISFVHLKILHDFTYVKNPEANGEFHI